MMADLFRETPPTYRSRVVEPFREMAAYEALWQQEKASYKWLSELFASNPGMLPSDLVGRRETDAMSQTLRPLVFSKDQDYKYYILIHGTFDFPSDLRDAREPLEILYYSGDLDLLGTGFGNG